MIDDVRFDTDAREPLELLWTCSATPEAYGDAACRGFEFSSRGDRVPARLVLPREGAAAGEAGGGRPLLLVQYEAGGSLESPLLASAAPWLQAGGAVATIDFPLHGARASAKLTERLLAGLAGEALGNEVTRQLLLEFTRQAVIDLRRLLDALARLDEVDDQRVAYAGFGLGAELGALFGAADPRPRAFVLAGAGGGLGPAGMAASAVIDRLAPRPVWFVNGENDEVVSRAAAEQLHAAAGAPHRIEWVAGRAADPPAGTLEAAWAFLRESLESR